MKKLLLRLQAATPPFFKKVQKIGASLIAAGVTIKVTQSQVHLTEFVTTLGTHLASIGATVVVIAQFAVQNVIDITDVGNDTNSLPKFDNPPAPPEQKP